ncbi:OmpA family protein [candidate division KSB1 bacterium]|nr:OmpA family protein [candidate division KSB1 bacterium]
MLRKLLLADDYEKLKKIEQELKKLRKQFSDDESFIETLDPVITDALERKIGDSKSLVAQTLAPVISDAIKVQINETREDVVDALYPIIGQTIRKSVSVYLKQLVDSINYRVNRAFNLSFLFKWLKSKLTGVSDGEWLFSDALPFKIKEVFVIHKSTGLLLFFASSTPSDATIDQEIISGMLSAIRNFISEAFNSDQDLDQIQYGDQKISLHADRYFYLACVVEGNIPAGFSQDLQDIALHIHNRHFKKLRDFDGDVSVFKTVNNLFVAFFNKYNHNIVPKKKTKPYFFITFIAVLFIFLLIFLGRFFLQHRNDEKIQQSAMSIINKNMHLNSNEQLNIDTEKGTLFVNGYLNNMENKLILDSLLNTLENIGEIDNKVRVIKPVDQILNRVNDKISHFRELRHFEPVFIIQNEQVVIEGIVPNQKIKREVAFLVGEIDGVRSVVNNLETMSEGIIDDLGILVGKAKTDTVKFSQLEKTIRAIVIYFDSNVAAITSLEEHAILEGIRDIMLNVQDFDLIIKGYADDVSDYHYNMRLSKIRAQAISGYLVSQGVSKDRLFIEYYGENNPVEPNATAEGRRKNRRVEFDIRLRSQF